jgi:hypothetical protein
MHISMEEPYKTFRNNKCKDHSLYFIKEFVYLNNKNKPEKNPIMKILLFLLFFPLLSFFACTSIQYQEVVLPCGKGEKGVQVRVVNAGELPFSEFFLVVQGNKYYFEGAAVGDTSCYRNFPYIMTNNDFDVEFREQADESLTTAHSDRVKIERRLPRKQQKPKLKKGTYHIRVFSKGSVLNPETPVIETVME